MLTDAERRAMDAQRLLHSLRISDSFFPVGAFAFSDGLETAASSGLVRDAATLGKWMEHFLEGVFVPCEGLALVKCMAALREDNRRALQRVDEELTAIRPSVAVRSSSTAIGRRLLSLYASICRDAAFPELAQVLPHGNAAAAYALVFFHRGIVQREAALAFGYNRLTGIVSAGLRLVAMGQHQGQLLLTDALDRLPDAVERILQMSEEPLRSFSPMMDIQQMNHQYVYSRLFRS